MEKISHSPDQSIENMYDKYFKEGCEKRVEDLLNIFGNGALHCTFGKIRSRRSLTSQVVKFVGSAATNLLRSYITEGDDDSLPLANIGLGYSNPYIAFRQDRLSELSSYSRTASLHRDQLLSVLDDHSELIYMRNRVHDAIDIAQANVKTIIKFCRRGRVATPEVSELIGSTMLEDMDQEKTTLLELKIVGKDKLFLRFLYTHEGSKGFGESINLLLEGDCTAAIMVATFIIVCLVTCAGLYFWLKRSKPELPQTNTILPENPSAPTQPGCNHVPLDADAEGVKFCENCTADLRSIESCCVKVLA